MYNPDLHNRRSTRLKGFDYSTEAAYFVTVCTHARMNLFGSISNDIMTLSVYGEIVHYEWLKTGRLHKNVEIDEFVIMPNHIHGIILLNDSQIKPKGRQIALPYLIRGFKTISSRRINKLRKMQGNPVWQRNYYEHIIRDDNELFKIREYIASNPIEWIKDEYHEP